MLNKSESKISNRCSQSKFYKDVKLKAHSTTDRKFGRFFCGIIVILIFYQTANRGHLNYYSLGILAIVVLAMIFVPVILAPVKILWIIVGSILHKVMAPLIMALLYFGIVSPYAMLLRIFGVRFLKMKWDSKSSSYWEPRYEKFDSKFFERQF